MSHSTNAAVDAFLSENFHKLLAEQNKCAYVPRMSTLCSSPDGSLPLTFAYSALKYYCQKSYMQSLSKYASQEQPTALSC